MAGIGPFYIDAEKKSNRRIRLWYKQNLMPVLEENKAKQVRGTEKSIELAKKLLSILDEKLPPQVVVPPHDLVPAVDDSLMKPIKPNVLDLLYKSTEKGSTELYLKARNKKSLEDKYYFRLCGSWDYGWQQKQSRVRPRDVNTGRCAILRETFYRKNNLAPDPPHYSQPAGAEVGICSEYCCYFSNPYLGPPSLS